MDILQEATDFFNDLSDSKFTLIFGNKKREQQVITISASDEHFPHLIGLDKLTDITSSIYRGKDKSQIVSGIQSGEITLSKIEKSSHYIHDQFEHSIENRIKFFPLIKPMFDKGIDVGEASFIFLKKKAYSKIDADYLLRLKIKQDSKEYYLNLFLKKDKESHDYIPISFFPRLNNNYEKNQTRLTLLYRKKEKGAISEELYVHKNYTPPSSP